MRLAEETNSYRRYEFEGMSDVLEYALSPTDMPDKERFSQDWFKGEHSAASWDFGAGWNGALCLARRGWPEGAKKIKELAERLYSRIAPQLVEKQTSQYDVTGHTVDVGRFVTGEPECMLEFAPIEVEGQRHVNILIDTRLAHTVPSRAVENRGAAILAIVEALRQSGCLVTLDAIGCHGDGGRRVRYDVHVVTAGTIIDTDMLAFMVVHSAYNRRIVFAMMEHLPADWRRSLNVTPEGGYAFGYELSRVEQEGLVYWTGLHSRNTSDFSTPEQALETCLNKLRPLGLLKEEEV